MNHNYFQGTPAHPYHISIGAIVRNGEGKICCHYFKKVTAPTIGTLEDFVLLMRETIEPHETIEACLARGLMEEFGMRAELKSYLGSIVSRFIAGESAAVIEKTTLYFLCDFVSMDESLRKEDDIEATSSIVWLAPDEVIDRMREQSIRLGREDVDESSIVERIAEFDLKEQI